MFLESLPNVSGITTKNVSGITTKCFWNHYQKSKKVLLWDQCFWNHYQNVSGITTNKSFVAVKMFLESLPKQTPKAEVDEKMDSSIERTKSSINSIEKIPTLNKSDIPTLEIDLVDVDFIRKDINMIVFPYFYFGGKNRYGVIKYNFDQEKSKKLIITALQGERVPGIFEYEIIQALLKFRESIKTLYPEKEGFYCTAWDIAKELNILYKDKKGYSRLSQTDKNRISTAINRLQSTNYELFNLYNIKETKKDGESSYNREEKLRFNILTDLKSIENKVKDGKTSFYIRFGDTFIESIKNKYHFTYEINKLNLISKTTAKRLFEIIDFKRKGKLKESFHYNNIAWNIPLNSGRKNRILINEYLHHLKNEAKVIIDYYADYPKGHFQVLFKRDTKKRIEELQVDTLEIPKATQLELFSESSMPDNKIYLSKEQNNLIEKYVKIKDESGKIKENISGYTAKIINEVSNNISLLDGIKKTVSIYDEIEQKKIEKRKRNDELKKRFTINDEPKSKLLTAEDIKNLKKELLKNLHKQQ